MILRGRCWTFGNDLCVDGDLIPFQFVRERETRIEVLKAFAMADVDPEVAKRAKPGDLIVAGRRFAQGNPHIQGLLALRGLGVGLVVESIPRGSFRNAVNAGLPILPRCPGITSRVYAGDELEVDFETGRVKDLTNGFEERYPSLPTALFERVQLGTWEQNFERRLLLARGRRLPQAIG